MLIKSKAIRSESAGTMTSHSAVTYPHQRVILNGQLLVTSPKTATVFHIQAGQLEASTELSNELNARM